MKKINLKKIVTIALVTLSAFSLVACGNNDDSADKNQEGNKQVQKQDNEEKVTDKWGLKINGKSVELPCTLEDLTKMDINLSNEFLGNSILNSSNETFYMAEAVVGDNADPVHLKLVTGSNPEKLEANVTVKRLTNTMMDSTLLELKNGIALGSNIDDVISTFGEDYNGAEDVTGDIHTGFVVIDYGTVSDGLLLNFRDGILEYIEIMADDER